MLHPHSLNLRDSVIGTSPYYICTSHSPNISAGTCYSPSLVTSTISPVILHNMPFPKVLGQQLGPSPFSRKFPAWKVNQAATHRGSILPAIPSGFHGSWNLPERWKPTVLVFQSPIRVLLSPLLTAQLLNRTCSESLHIGLGTLVSETPPSSYSSSLQLSEGRHRCTHFPLAPGRLHFQGSLSSLLRKWSWILSCIFKLGCFGDFISKSPPSSLPIRHCDTFEN